MQATKLHRAAKEIHMSQLQLCFQLHRKIHRCWYGGVAYITGYRLQAANQNLNHKTSKYGFETLSEFLLFHLYYLLFIALLRLLLIAVCSYLLILQEKRSIVWYIKQYKS